MDPVEKNAAENLKNLLLVMLSPDFTVISTLHAYFTMQSPGS